MPKEDTLLGAVFNRYQAELKRMNAVDFDDLLLLAVRLLREHPEAREKWRDRFHYLMVDEFQDTNRLQLDLVSMLAHGEPPNVCVVGDDDQSIYGWRGAEVSNILEFERHFPNPTVIKLEQNYRSTNAILHTANSLIKNNPRRRPKTLWSEHGAGDKVPRRPRADRPGGSRLRHQPRCTGCKSSGEAASWDDFAILFRMNSQSKIFELAMQESSIPYRIVGGQSIFDKREVKDLLAYIGCLLNTDDDGALLRIINLPPRGLGDTTVERALDYSREHKMSLFAAINDEAFLETVSAKTRGGVPGVRGVDGPLRIADARTRRGPRRGDGRAAGGDRFLRRIAPDVQDRGRGDRARDQRARHAARPGALPEAATRRRVARVRGPRCAGPRPAGKEEARKRRKRCRR